MFYQTVVDLDIPLRYIHMNNGIRGTDERLSRFGLDLILGYAHEETIVGASLVLGGVISVTRNLCMCFSRRRDSFSETAV